MLGSRRGLAAVASANCRRGVRAVDHWRGPAAGLQPALKARLSTLPCQRHLFPGLPDDEAEVCYLNAAYMSPSLKSTEEAWVAGATRKSSPWNITTPDFYDGPERLRAATATLIGAASPDCVALVPSSSCQLTVKLVLPWSAKPGWRSTRRPFSASLAPLPRCAVSRAADRRNAPSLTRLLAHRFGHHRRRDRRRCSEPRWPAVVVG